MVKLLSNKKVTTRSFHLCFACCRPFLKGTVMYSSVNSNKKKIYTLYTCNTCNELLNKFPDLFFNDGDEGIPEFCVGETLHLNRDCKRPEDLLAKFIRESTSTKFKLISVTRNFQTLEITACCQFLSKTVLFDAQILGSNKQKEQLLFYCSEDLEYKKIAHISHKGFDNLGIPIEPLLIYISYI